MKKVGFIGLGIMGRRMATNILKAGFPLTVYDVVPERVEALVRLGARGASSPKEVGGASDVVLLSLPGPSEVGEVVLGGGGVLSGIRAGGIVVDLSTSDPPSEREIYDECRRRGVRYLDAPVIGGPEGAERATLTITVGGDREAFEEALDILRAIGKNIFHVGPPGMGQVYKLVNNMLSLTHIVTAAEALIFAAKAGCDLKLLYEIIKVGTGYSKAFERRAPRMIEGEFEPAFTINNTLKDLELILKHASRTKTPLPITSIVYQIYEAAKANGLENMDAGAVIRVLEKLANTKVTKT